MKEPEEVDANEFRSEDDDDFDDRSARSEVSERNNPPISSALFRVIFPPDLAAIDRPQAPADSPPASRKASPAAGPTASPAVSRVPRSDTHSMGQ